MCDADSHSGALPASAGWAGEVLSLEPVDDLSLLMVCGNSMDVPLPDQGPAQRMPLASMSRQAPMVAAPTLAGGKMADAPLDQHGFSAWSRCARAARCAGCCPASG